MIDHSNLSDEELAHRLKLTDRAAFAEVYNRYKGLLYVHAYKRLKSEEEADDVVHDLFATLWSKRAELDLNNLSAYLYVAVRNNIFKHIARQNVATNYITSAQITIDQTHCITDHLIREKQLTEIIENEISALPERMREVFELSRKRNLTHREIAQQLNLSEQTVKKHIHHALKILRVKLGLSVFLLLLMK
jgi:RNA polymerase sigma-70 factor (ECF subfamily)